MSTTELVLIGGGNMGEAMLRGIVRSGLLPPAAVVVVEPVKERRTKLADELKIGAVEDSSHAPAAPRYVLAVKPQQMEAATQSLRAAMGPSALVISIAAGISTGYLAKALGAAARIIRAMPNTPMLVGVGCTCICPGRGALAEDMDFAQRLFSAGGMVRVVEEPAMDAVTAMSGSGPAYFFYLMEAMIEAGAAEGLSVETATVLAYQTCAGAAALMAQSGQSPAALRAKVTSPGGTTQAAIETLDRAGVRDALIRAVRAAAERSRELGK